MDAKTITGLVLIQIVCSLLLFAAALAILVFFLRKPLRRYKPADMAIFEKIKPGVNSLNNRIMLFITFLGKHQFLVPANLALILFLVFISRQNWFFIRVITISLSSLVLMLLLKQLFRRKRPLAPLLEAAKGLSFPSGHAIMAVTFYGLLIYIIEKMVAAGWIRFLLIFLLVILILGIGYSRVYLRVHYASDVLAGFVIGFCWLAISLAVINKIEAIAKEEINTEEEFMPALITGTWTNRDTTYEGIGEKTLPFSEVVLNQPNRS